MIHYYFIEKNGVLDMAATYQLTKRNCKCYHHEFIASSTTVDIMACGA